MNNLIQFRDDELKQLLMEIDASPSTSARWIIETYLEWVLPDTLRRLNFTKKEALLLWDNLNGVRFSPDTLQLMWANIENEALQSKVKNLSLGEMFAIAVAIKRVGGQSYHVDDLASELKRVRLTNGEH
jgi:hypothetical protein